MAPNQPAAAAKELSMDIGKLAKLLALCGSPNEQEALAALRGVRRLLEGVGADFHDLAALLRDAGDADALERELDDTRRRLKAAQAGARSARAGQTEATELRRKVGDLTLDNDALRAALDGREAELEQARAERDALAAALDRANRDKRDLIARIRRQKLEMDQIAGEVRNVMSLTTRLRHFVGEGA